MTYPTGNLGVGGLLVGVLTHGLIVEGGKQNQRTQQQQEADKVWEPYMPILTDFGYRELAKRALSKTSSPGSVILAPDPNTETNDTSKTAESAPVFLMTKDQSAIMLENTVLLYEQQPGSTGINHQTSMRVISDPRETDDPIAFWTGNNGEALKEEKARLLALSLDIAMFDLSGGTGQSDLPYKTVRYREGSAEKMERAQVLVDRCNRILLRTLRGALISVPSARPAESGSENCRHISHQQPS